MMHVSFILYANTMCKELYMLFSDDPQYRIYYLYTADGQLIQSLVHSVPYICFPPLLVPFFKDSSKVV